MNTNHLAEKADQKGTASKSTSKSVKDDKTTNKTKK
ncbi:hypothetical protein J2W48_000668 [Flavobacterium piscis]|uniref:Uncharacterized protein n=1 Tax=Flavobacterium piscis TaxID=1114874 RepID=A0ABU1Y3J7_9FLAO|nr:hypothetical protein [Flavobacterium piscis]